MQALEKLAELAREEIEGEVQKYREALTKKKTDALAQEIAKHLLGNKKVHEKKKRAKRIKSGFTPPEQFVAKVKSHLSNGPMLKKDLAFKIIAMGGLLEADLHKHRDGQYRFYKTLDRTRRLMTDNATLKVNNGMWQLC
jgi:hypothetical protein